MAATAGPLLRISGLDGLAIGALWLVAAASGLVFREPAPYDVLLAALMAAFLAAGLRAPRAIAPLAILLTLIVAGDFIGTARTSAPFAEASAHSWVTFYLALSIMFFACVGAWKPDRSVSAILSGMTIAALVAALAGIAGYFSLLPGAEELFTLFGRARGTFKDPNVFGPFLVLPLLFATARLLTARGGAGLVWTAVAGILALGLLLSFSRGAWVHMAISASVFALLVLLAVPDRAITRRAAMLVILGIFVIAAGLAAALSNEEISALMSERAKVVQNYDSGAQGRFAGQAKALGVIVAEPLGVGFGGFSRFHPEQPHNVYLNVFLNAGWLGGFAYLAIVLATFARAVTIALRTGPVQPVAIAIAATYVGLMVEGLFVDTDHWRHYAMVTGLVWGIGASPDLRVPAAGIGRSGRI